MIDRVEEAKVVLEDTPGLRSLSDEWPDAETVLPAIVVGLASKRPDDRRDNRWYTKEVELYVRIFAYTDAETHSILEGVYPRMEALGYEGTFEFDQNLAGARQRVTRWKKTISTD